MLVVVARLVSAQKPSSPSPLASGLVATAAAAGWREQPDETGATKLTGHQRFDMKGSRIQGTTYLEFPCEPGCQNDPGCQANHQKYIDLLGVQAGENGRR
jgi:hypothetical protein